MPSLGAIIKYRRNNGWVDAMLVASTQRRCELSRRLVRQYSGCDTKTSRWIGAWSKLTLLDRMRRIYRYPTFRSEILKTAGDRHQTGALRQEHRCTHQRADLALRWQRPGASMKGRPHFGAFDHGACLTRPASACRDRGKRQTRRPRYSDDRKKRVDPSAAP